MLPSDDIMRAIRRENKAKAVTEEIKQRFRQHRNMMIEAFAGLSLEDKQQAFVEINALLSAKVNGL
jgi:hypothetical protein